MSNQKRKRNHWVPQAYLKHFATPASAGRQIWTMSKEAGPAQLRPLRQVPIKFYLYAPRSADGRRNYEMEERLSGLEQWFAHRVWHTVAHDYVDLANDNIRKMVALLAATMFLRNPLRLETTREVHQSFVELFSSSTRQPDVIEIGGQRVEVDYSDWEEFRTADEDAVKRMWLQQISTAGWLAEILMEMRWSVVVSEEARFITTDNPVVLMNQALTSTGFKKPDAICLFPVSPTRVLCMDRFTGETPNKYYRADNPAAQNLLLWRGAIDSMFSPRHPNLVCDELLALTEGFDQNLKQL